VIYSLFARLAAGLSFMSSKFIHIFIFIGVLIFGVADANGQKRRNKHPAVDKPVAVVAEKTQTNASEVKTEPTPAKKNSRGTETHDNAAAVVQNVNSFTHFYEFSQPDFTTNRITIRHDDKGRGDISFSKNGSDETITDPVQLSGITLERIAATLAELDFLNSTENYQYEKDYSHLGNIKFTLKSGGRSRTTTYNWTENKAAKALMDEYRRIGHQYVWMFDIGVARANQPLEAPKLMDTLDGYFRRGEISDPEQMIPFLRGLSDDERIPLIARNHAAKLVKQIEKQSEKAKK
jgi:hypothetical protein